MRPDSQLSTNKQDLKPLFFSMPWSSLQQPVDVRFHAASGSGQLGNSSGNNAPSSLNVHQSRNSNKLPYFFLHEGNGTKTMFKKYKFFKLRYLQLER
jgi:hypothetical protein